MLWMSIALAGEPLPTLGWDWSAPQRFLVETEVQLPIPLVTLAERNRRVRIVGFQLQWVLSCDGSGQGGRWQDVTCQVEDASIVAGVMPGDRGQAGPILQEMVDVLERYPVRFRLHERGHLVQTELLADPVRQHRVRRRDQAIEEVARFGLVGFEVPMQHEGRDKWLTTQSSLCVLQSSLGVSSPVEAVHQGVRRRGVVEYASHLRGLVVTRGIVDRYSCEATVRGFVEPGAGAVKVDWDMVGEATAASLPVLGGVSQRFTQHGGMRRLDATERPVLQPTAEIVLAPDGTVVLDVR
jgi:hypothetical protein